MEIGFGPAKREWTLQHSGLNFHDAAEFFAGPEFTFDDDRRDYGEPRDQTFGLLRERVVVVIWTLRGGDTRHVISMRKANERERKRYDARMG